MDGELAGEIEDIGKIAIDLAITIVPGTFDEGKFPIVDWDTRSTPTWKTYLILARELGCALVVLEKYEFDELTLGELEPEWPEEDVEEIDEEEIDRESTLEAKWEKIAGEYSGYYGSLYAYSLYYFTGGICHRWRKEATWYNNLADDANALSAELEAEQAELEEEETPDLTDKEIEKMASELANYDLFQKATNQTARRFALKKKFPKLAKEHYDQISEIIEQAKGTFELEIKPDMENALDNRISELIEEGLNNHQIAKKLKVTISRVKKAV